ncbi:thiamine pyrophosphate-binding protein [Streptomyces sp. NPDC017993]|uniref:thiamine pyrophosphate-binding protein n=1 Tax=Streptomyces sp. NPDC017993 TaxID=3365027 RepID=UPI0037B24AB9
MAPRTVTGGEALVRALAAHGTDLAFGIPGTHNLEIYRHLAGHGIRHIAPRHEQGAGYAADGYARATGRPGVAITTTGPALLNIAAAVGQAHSDSVPLLVVSPGMPLRHPSLATGTLHEMPGQSEAFGHLTAFSHRVTSVEEIDAAVARAFTRFRSRRPRPVHIEVPLDLLTAAAPVGPPRLAPPHLAPRPQPESVRAAATALNRARRPALVLGGGAHGAKDEVLELAGRLCVPVATTANGKGAFPESHPLAVGVRLHSAAVQKWLADCDAVLAVGTELAESDLWSALPALTGTLIRVDIDPAQMYAGRPADIPLVGDARETVRGLLDELTLSEGGSGPDAGANRSAGVLGSAAALRTAADATIDARDTRRLPFLAAMRSVLPPETVWTSDSAQCCYYGALPHLPVDPPGRYLHPTGFGTLGYALPAAVGVKAGAPERPVVALSGDGGLQFTVQELATAADLGLPLPVVVFDNGGYGEIRDEMSARGDAPVAVDHPPLDLGALARAYGGQGTRAATPAELADALRTALTVPGPTVITVPEPTGSAGLPELTEPTAHTGTTARAAAAGRDGAGSPQSAEPAANTQHTQHTEHAEHTQHPDRTGPARRTAPTGGEHP